SLSHPLLHPFPTRRSSDLSVGSLASAFRNPRSLAFLSSTRYAVFRSGMTQRIVRLGKESGSGSASESFFINERMLCSTSAADARSEEHTSELQSRSDIVCR